MPDYPRLCPRCRELLRRKPSRSTARKPRGASRTAGRAIARGQGATTRGAGTSYARGARRSGAPPPMPRGCAGPRSAASFSGHGGASDEAEALDLSARLWLSPPATAGEAAAARRGRHGALRPLRPAHRKRRSVGAGSRAGNGAISARRIFSCNRSAGGKIGAAITDGKQRRVSNGLRVSRVW